MWTFCWIFCRKGDRANALSHTIAGNSDPAVSMNPWIFVGATVFALVIVFISAGKPAKLAAKVSPVEAVRYTEGKGRRRNRKNGRRRENQSDGTF